MTAKPALPADLTGCSYAITTPSGVTERYPIEGDEISFDHFVGRVGYDLLVFGQDGNEILRFPLAAHVVQAGEITQFSISDI